MVPPADDGSSPAPIDRPILEYLQLRLDGSEFVHRARIDDESGHLQLSVRLASSYYPESVDVATLDIRWYTNDDFKIHYREVHSGEIWECRWDRHPNPHNTRDHFHPPPEAPTRGTDATWPGEYRDVVSLVLDEIEERIHDLWGG